MKHVLYERFLSTCVLGTLALMITTFQANAAKPSSGGDGTTTVATTSVDEGYWTITRLLTAPGYQVGYDVGFVDGMAQIGQINSSGRQTAGAQFVWQNSSGWQKQPVISAEISNSLSFTVAGDGRAAMAFTVGKTGALQYAERSSPSGAWSITTVESQNVNRSYGNLDVEFDSDGNPAIAYNVGSNPAVIRLARRIDRVWQKQIVRSLATTAGRVSLAFNGTEPVIAHSDDLLGDGGGHDTVRLARLSTGAAWTSEIVASDLHTSPSGMGASYIDVSIIPSTGEADVVHGSHEHVRYSEKVDGSWFSKPIGDEQNIFGASLDHDAQGRPHIALGKGTGIYHLSREADVWSESLVRQTDPTHLYDVGRAIVRIDGDDRPTVLYVKDANGSAVSGGYELELARRSY